MLGNCEKMVVIPSTSNEWPENQIDEKGMINMASSTSTKLMEKPTQDQAHQQHQPLKCPRCDSSNTKFCYYNNYSLSQPRHFCKACKRYWTRGGTLRNVPVGGGCRKNKRVKRPATSSSGHEVTNSSSSAPTTNPTVQTAQIDLSSSASHINPLFYSLLSTSPAASDLNLPYPRFNSSRVSNINDSASGFDLQPPQINGIGLGFSSSGLFVSDVQGSEYRNGLPPAAKQNIEQVVSSNSFLSSYPIFGSTSTSTSTMASLIASSLQQQKLISSGFKDAQLAANNNLHHQLGSYEAVLQVPRNVKIEDAQNRLDHWNLTNQNNNEQVNINSSSDASSLLWNATGVGAWLDPSNIGSSVPSLI